MAEFWLQLILNSILVSSVYVLISLGYTLIYGVSRFFNIAHGAMAVVGAYTAFYLIQFLEIGNVLAIIIAILFTGFLGWLSKRFLYEPLANRKASDSVLLVASLGLFLVIQALVAILFTSQVQTLSQFLETRSVFEIFGISISGIQVIIILSAVIVSITITLLLKFTKFGKSVRAITNDKEVAQIVGINTKKVISYVFFIGSALAGLAGILIGFDTFIEPTTGLNVILKGAIASIIGGLGSIYGAIIGALLLGFAENFGILFIGSEWKDAIAFVLLILFLIFRPRGIVNK